MNAPVLPRESSIRRLSRLVPGYPVTLDELLWTAKKRHFSPGMIKFLGHYPANRSFVNEEDFIDESLAIELLEKELPDMPHEKLRSPQD